MNARVHVFVSGKVQGVFFRSGTKDKADELCLTGWVRNLQDGRVEAVFEGEEGRVEKMVEWCRKGPEYARVTGVEVIPEQYKGEFSGFWLRR
jgi:acylphosphatase